jgi:hypothetical protein
MLWSWHEHVYAHAMTMAWVLHGDAFNACLDILCL